MIVTIRPLRLHLYALLAVWLVLAACSGSGGAAPASGEAASAPTATTAPTTAAPAAEDTTEDAPASTEITETTAATESVAVALPTVTNTPAADAEAPAEATSVPAPSFSPQETQITFIPVAEGLAAPLYVTHAGDGSGRLFVVEKDGVIRIVQEGNLLPEPFLDITDRVGNNANEQGLLGLAFAPNYTDSGFFFVNYTDDNGDTVVSRFQVTGDNANAADPASEFIVLQVDQPAANHNGGMLLFGPDGYLWIGLGDGGAANDRFGNGQNPETLLGKMLRLDVTSDPSVPYTIPADNPWVNADWNGADVRDEIWAVGLRNPWRYSFDRATGDLWIADVGQNQYEEINFTPAAEMAGGHNYGWPLMEGLHCFQQADCTGEGLVIPVAEYDHSGHCSVTGGYVYRGQQYPALQGVYFYGDYCSGTIWALWPEGDDWRNEIVLRSGFTLSSFGEDADGEIYATDLVSGVVYQLAVE